MKIALGPVQYYWSRVAMLQFYEAMCDVPVDIVYLGETVCSRRHELRLEDWLEVADMLTLAGKQVVLSTQVLIESRQDLATLKKITANQRYQVEANDMGAVHNLTQPGFVAGPFLNIYNEPTLQVLAGLGAVRWVMPLEMGAANLTLMQKGRPGGMQTELFAYGRMPLAFSARCFTARHRNIPKDNCQYVCMDYPDGLVLRTREQEPFLVLNGIQTQSAKVYTLIQELDQLQGLGVDVLRISPQAQHTDTVVQLFRNVMSGTMAADQAFCQLQQLAPGQLCNGYWHGLPGMELKVA